MAPLKYVGSDFEAGSVQGNCVTGFDNAAFVMGTSSSLFNAVIAELIETQKNGILAPVFRWIKDLAEKITHRDDDIAMWKPNPFKGWNPSANKGVNAKILSLVDGGEDYQNIPLYPHIQPIRKVDVVFAVDSSADSGNMDGWPNGTAMVATYDRHQGLGIANGTAFPAVPDVNTFTNLGLNSKPSFFGCDSKNLTGPSPIIVYIANHPYTFYSNISTAISTIKNAERDALIRNGYHVATMGNGTIEPEWPACVACAVLSRSFDRTGTTPPAMCQTCFNKHCWNGTLAPSKPPRFLPKLAMPDSADSNASKGKGHGTDKNDLRKKSIASHLRIEASAAFGFVIAMAATLLL
jgi:lysophospholipase